MKKFVRKFVPGWLLSSYHYAMARLGAFRYGFPSKKMVVIGVTGTKGKTSTANFVWACLRAGGHKTGIISTANIRIGDKELLNKYHMTMPGRFTVQRLMAAMVNEGCEFCVVETTSQGILQYRHVGVYYDIAVFTNLSPEHMGSHGGSLENYKRTKGKMFAHLLSHKKIFGGKPVEKTIIANRDSEYADYFLGFGADRKITFALNGEADYRAGHVRETSEGVGFSVGDASFTINTVGRFNVYNVMPAIIIARLFGVPDSAIAEGLRSLRTIPGRMEKIEEGQPFTVFVDYAHEKESMTNALRTANIVRSSGARTIVLLGAEGGGRDKAKRAAMGDIAGKLADYVVVSNVDPYDDDPLPIIEDIAAAAEEAGKKRNEDLFAIEDRREGIRRAIALAKAGDVVLITGKGAEQSIMLGGKRMAWDDRDVTREELRRMINAK